MEPPYEELIRFHGHSCPGLAIGYRMSKAGLDFLNGSKAKDEELVAIVENDACGVDALQCLTGCTFGKGTLIFKDYGKQAYTLYNRKSRKGVRIVFDPKDIPVAAREKREELIKWLLKAPEKEVVALKEVRIIEPEPARIMSSIKCDICGEGVMETRTRIVNEKKVCIPCAETQP